MGEQLNSCVISQGQMSNFTNLTMCSQFEKNNPNHQLCYSPGPMCVSVHTGGTTRAQIVLPRLCWSRYPGKLLLELAPEKDLAQPWSLPSQGVNKPTGVGYSLAKGWIHLTLFWHAGEIGWGKFKMSFKQIFCLLLRKMAGLNAGKGTWAHLSPTGGIGCQHRWGQSTVFKCSL